MDSTLRNEDGHQVVQIDLDTGDWLARIGPDGSIRVNADLSEATLRRAVMTLIGRMRWLASRQTGMAGLLPDRPESETPDRPPRARRSPQKGNKRSGVS